MADELPATFTSTRRDPRMRIASGVAVLVDGHPAGIVDLSTGGAQITSDVAIRPNQLVRVTLVTTTRSLRLVALVAWSTFERPGHTGQPQYRLGVTFTGGDVGVVQEVCHEHDATRA
jgi:hypothetical protein